MADETELERALDAWVAAALVERERFGALRAVLQRGGVVADRAMLDGLVDASGIGDDVVAQLRMDEVNEFLFGDTREGDDDE